MPYRSELHGLYNVHFRRSCNPACLHSRKFSLFFYLFLTLFMYGLPSHGQSMDSSGYPVLWLRADKGMFTDTSWTDFSGNGYYGLFFGQGQRKKTLLNYNPALTFNGTDDSVRIAYNLDSLSEMTYIAVFVPADTSETAIWGNDGVAPSPSAYLMVGSTGQGGGIPPFKGALAELLV